MTEDILLNVRSKMSAADLLRPLFIRPVPDQPLYESRIQEEFALIDKNLIVRI